MTPDARALAVTRPGPCRDPSPLMVVGHGRNEFKALDPGGRRREGA